jgi:hypothetical protein
MAGSLAGALKYTPLLSVLSLPENHFKPADAAFIAGALRCLPRLTVLNLDLNSLSDFARECGRREAVSALTRCRTLCVSVGVEKRCQL